MKKLFVIMTLVLCMVLAALPVFANQPAPAEKNNDPLWIETIAHASACNLTLKMDKEDPHFLDCMDGKCVPVYLVEKDVCAKNGFNPTMFFNHGEPVAWVQTAAMIDELSIATEWWSKSELNVANGGEWQVGYPFVQHVAKIKVTVDTVKYVNVGPTAEEVAKLPELKKAADDAEKALKEEERKENAKPEDIAVAKAKAEVAAKAYAEARTKVQNGTDKAELDKIEIPGVLLVVEPAVRTVNVKHVFNVNGQETVYTEVVKVAKDTVLTKEDAKKFAKVSQMIGDKKVDLVWNEAATKFDDGTAFSYTLWDYVKGDYAYVLYYTAAKAADKTVDAAANPAVAGNTGAKKLPATGVAETLPMMSAALLVVAGLLIAKKH